MNIYEIEVTAANGESYKLERYKGHPMLIVNTATKCGLVGQFDALETLNKKYVEQGLVVLGFPSNQFKQELSTGAEAAEACRLSYGVTFPMHDVVKVNGSEAHPLFQLLSEETKGILGKSVKWNFTKFLVDREGNVIKRYAPTDNPMKFEKDIENYL
ncbi:glutathione peroxidase [Solibacillus sp. FSL H8-0538]|uniref:glutathione peroxidase n=1 Tax=Solibacillus sp. FSL H8-0538 TaxID=2921400 RepID=UPI0030F94E21